MHRFTPPTTTYRVGHERDSLWGRVSNEVGLAVVVYDDGRVVTARTAPSASDDGVSIVWPGGRTYEITDEQAELLTEAGYSQYLEVIE